jgi:hypothetical protein
MEAWVVPSFFAAATWEKLKFSISRLATIERKAGRTERTTTSQGGRNLLHKIITPLLLINKARKRTQKENVTIVCRRRLCERGSLV